MTERWDWARAVVGKVYDGDTFTASSVDLGMEIVKCNVKVRLAGIDAPELRPLQPGAKEAKAALAELLPEGESVSLSSVGYDKYGSRVDAVVTRCKDAMNVNEEMIRSGHAKPYDGGKR